ncbi:hypothetical protein BG60_14005 [Caballeronia zhejiangensis]|uniref:Uncharacterized protein n=1 Tax=Caballeronia zhejiangensis TaxID=871203 RepID=A0A656QRQ4_9BURK|nr:hypothetical protein BG60_14005 [Caballeronia zhejiangensis]
MCAARRRSPRRSMPKPGKAVRNAWPRPSAARISASPQRNCREGRRSATGALSTNFLVRIEVAFDGRVNAAVLGGTFGHDAGHADGGRSRDEYQGDHRDSKGQFHGIPGKRVARSEGGRIRKRARAESGLKQFVGLGLTCVLRCFFEV